VSHFEIASVMITTDGNTENRSFVDIIEEIIEVTKQGGRIGKQLLYDRKGNDRIQ
jgi:hypothetical protein